MDNSNADSWLASLPENPGPERDQMILDAVSSGLAFCQWMPVNSTIDGHSAVFMVCDDAVRVELEDGSRFRFQVTEDLTQQCADLMEASMLTTKIMDLSYLQADKKISATIFPANPDMVTTTKSKLFNAAVEKKRDGCTSILRDTGKAWVLDNTLLNGAGACNYGYYSPEAPYTNPHGIKMWQCLGHKHRHHQDFSQVLFLMSNKCAVDGQEMNVISVMKDPVLSYLINYDGVLHYTRQP